MKLNGILGTGSGKLGTSVFTTVKGTQIVRQHQPVVTNPSTKLQVAQRSRFKLVSQIAASMADVIAIPRIGLTSSRNLFIKKNMPVVRGNVEGAQVSYEKLQLTNGTAALPAIVATRSGSNLTLKLASNANGIVNRVIYCIFKKSSENQLMLNNSAIVSDAGEDGSFQLQITDIAGDLAIYAYGMKDTSAAASATFGNYKVTNASDVATLVSNRSISSKDFIFTKTNGTTIYSGENENVTVGENQVMVYLYVGENGEAKVKIGEGNQVPVLAGKSFRKAVDKGSKIVFTAFSEPNYISADWVNNSDGSSLSSSTVYTVNSVQDNIDISISFVPESV